MPKKTPFLNSMQNFRKLVKLWNIKKGSQQEKRPCSSVREISFSEIFDRFIGTLNDK